MAASLRNTYKPVTNVASWVKIELISGTEWHLMILSPMATHGDEFYVGLSATKTMGWLDNEQQT